MRKVKQEEIEDLFKAVMSLENMEECKRFMRDLLTQSEIDEAAIRWKVARMLDENHTYVEIEKETGLSSTTVARVHKWLEEGKGGYKIMLQRLKNNKIKGER